MLPTHTQCFSRICFRGFCCFFKREVLQCWDSVYRRIGDRELGKKDLIGFYCKERLIKDSFLVFLVTCLSSGRCLQFSAFRQSQEISIFPSSSVEVKRFQL
ncbi:uncharacterized protein [Asterias amurensis]|uniref:uncharacterized protein isoform X2 n=1 Tax=Asterias amurensis TaxID=7602 RepID=UPI003AB6ED72